MVYMGDNIQSMLYKHRWMRKIYKHSISIASVATMTLSVSCAPTPHPALKIGQAYAIDGETYQPKIEPYYNEVGKASWYGSGFHKKRTANGDVFDKEEYTGAHKTLPLPSIVKVTNLDNNRSVFVKVNDRGPFVKGRIIDVSENAARSLGFMGRGTARVRVELDRDASLALLDDPKLKVKGAEKKLIQEAYLKNLLPPGKFQENQNLTDLKITQNQQPIPQVLQPEMSNEPLAISSTGPEPMQKNQLSQLQQEKLMSQTLVRAPRIPVQSLQQYQSTNQQQLVPPQPSVSQVSYLPPNRNISNLQQPLQNQPINRLQNTSQGQLQNLQPTLSRPQKNLQQNNTALKNYRIQVAATTVESDARQIAGNFKNLSGNIEQAIVNGRIYFRVRISGLSSLETAEKTLTYIKSKGYKDAFIL